MITNILLGLIIIALIIIICGRQEKHTITMFTQENEKAFVPNTIEVVDLRDPVSKLPDCKDETGKQVKPNQVEEEQICMTAGLPTHEDCPIAYVRELPNQINPKHEHTQEQLNILIKLAGKELTDEQVKIYFSKATNTLIYRYGDACVKKEYHGKDFLNYTLLKHNRVIRVLYKEDLKEFDKVLFKKEAKEEKKELPQESEYKEKVKDFMNLKRSTMLPDESLIKKVGISREMLHRHISKEEMTELKELRKTCQSMGMNKIKQRGLRGNV